MKKISILAFILLITVPIQTRAGNANWVGRTLNGEPCTGRDPNFGPFDYSKRSSKSPENLTVVESYHFTPEVENLVRGNTDETPANDLDYTLVAWPNHHRALLSVINYQLKYNSKLSKSRPRKMPECYLQRAIHFSPEDAVSYSLYGYYLYKVGHLDTAAKYYEKAMELKPNNSKIAYSYGLLLIDLKRLEDANKYAKIAYSDKGAPQGLKNKLIKLGAWTE